MILEIFIGFAFAQNNISEEVLESLPQDESYSSSKRQINSTTDSHVTKHVKGFHKKGSNAASGNLDSSLLRGENVDEFRTPTQIPKNIDAFKESKLLVGSKLKALINSDIIAYANSQSPIEAIVLEGQYKGSTLIGNATMDAQTKRVGVEFTKLRKQRGEGVFEISAVVREKNGELGLDGKYESFYWQYFASETILNTVSGFADATTQRAQQSNGGYVTVPSLDSATKQGLASGLSKSADRMGEKIRNAPEYVTARGPFVVQVLILN